MTALPKRKPARRTTMAPEPEPEQRPVPSWAELTAPLKHYQAPVIITNAERVACDAYIDHIRDGADQDQVLLDAWHSAATQATFGPLLDWLRQAPAMMP